MIDAGNLKYQDKPITNPGQDMLDRGPFVDSLSRALLREHRDGAKVSYTATGNVVGLVGKWGLGKSSILRLLKTKLDKTPHVACVLFNPWLFKGRDELLNAYFNSMREEIGKSAGEHAHAINKELDEYWNAIDWLGKKGSVAADTLGAHGLASLTWGFISGLRRKPKEKSVEKQREILEQKLADSKSAVVVLVDEVDRVEDEDIRAIAQLIKALGDISGISYLVAYDPERVADALGRGSDLNERQKSGSLYLEKIIQHPIPLRPLFSSDVEALLLQSLTDYDINLGDLTDEHSRGLLAEITSAITTPREVKRLVGAFAVLEEAVRGEIHRIDVLAYCWILTKSPILRQAMETFAERLVDDPDQDEAFRRGSLASLKASPPETVVEIFGTIALPFEPLLRRLFPRFGRNGDIDDGTRLCLQRNLIRALYLGNPPGMFRRQDVEQIWAEPNQRVVVEKLQALQKDGRLRALINRLDDLLPQLDTAGDVIFWPALAQVLLRPQDWVTGYDERTATANDAVAAIDNISSRNDESYSRVMAIVKSLIDQNDLVLAPGVLRKQVFSHGITSDGQYTFSKSPLTMAETKTLLETELARYENALRSGFLLKRVPTLQAMNAIIDVARYATHNIRAVITSQLDSLEAITTYATLLVPPGYGIDPTALNEFIDIKEVDARTDQFIAEKGMPEDDWVRTCLMRLQSVMTKFLRAEKDETWGQF